VTLGFTSKVIPYSGCLEVTVAGARPGTFVIDYCCVWTIVDMEGSHLMRRAGVERSGGMSYSDSPVRLQPGGMSKDVGIAVRERLE
jgi:hypothetical protein